MEDEIVLDADDVPYLTIALVGRSLHINFTVIDVLVASNVKLVIYGISPLDEPPPPPEFPPPL